MLGSLLSRKGRQPRREGTETVGGRGCSLRVEGSRGWHARVLTWRGSPSASSLIVKGFIAICSPPRSRVTSRAEPVPTPSIAFGGEQGGGLRPTVHSGSHRPPAATKHLKCGWFQLRCALSVITSFCCSLLFSCAQLCNLMDHSAPGFPVLHLLPERAQTHVH